MGKKATKQGFSIQGFDANHYQKTEEYIQVVDAIYGMAINDFSKLGSNLKIDPEKPFSFSDFPSANSAAVKILNTFSDRISSAITKGSREQWLYACKKNDEFLNHILNTSQVPQKTLAKFQDRNLDALEAFQRRKVDGMNLSQRIWNYTEQFKTQMELGLDIGIGDGRSAQALSRDLRDFLVDPDKLFRRVRDKHGNLTLSKAAKAYNPGRGKYRSSYKNTMRLTRSEVNMAYRMSDHIRWQKLDFVVGFEIKTSNKHDQFLKEWRKNNPGKTEICDLLKGKYPKTFVFKGWHPHCMCYAVPILMAREEFNTDELNELKAAIKGTEYQKFQSKNMVTEVPDGFKQWMADNEELSKGWTSQPYFVRDNFEGGTIAGGLKITTTQIHLPVDIHNQKSNIHPIKNVQNQNVSDNPHPAIKPNYGNPKDVADTISVISDGLSSDKWFQRGTHTLEITRDHSVNGKTDLFGRIWLKPDRINHVNSAMSKIGQKRSQDITEDEADAMATYWHEITHNRNKVGTVYKTKLQTQFMELANEYVSRKTLPEFYSTLGCAKTPIPKFIDDRKSTGYNAMVTNYDFVIKSLKLDGVKVLETVKNHLFNQSYVAQKKGLIQGLIDGGIKKVDGQMCTKTEVNKLVDLCGRGYPIGHIENWLKFAGFI